MDLSKETHPRDPIRERERETWRGRWNSEEAIYVSLPDKSSCLQDKPLGDRLHGDHAAVWTVE